MLYIIRIYFSSDTEFLLNKNSADIIMKPNIKAFIFFIFFTLMKRFPITKAYSILDNDTNRIAGNDISNTSRIIDTIAVPNTKFRKHRTNK